MNLIAEKRGLVEPEVVIEVVAHYDTVPATVGAIDNASGVAALLEVARVCADAPTERTLRFVFTAMEEHGLQGARAHVRLLQARAEAGTERLDAALVLDPVGVTNRAPDSQDSPVRIPFLFWPPSTGDFLGVFGNWGSSGVAGQVQQVAERYAPDLATYTVKRLTGMLDDGRRSDHAPYWDAGYQAVWLASVAGAGAGMVPSRRTRPRCSTRSSAAMPRASPPPGPWSGPGSWPSRRATPLPSGPTLTPQGTPRPAGRPRPAQSPADVKRRPRRAAHSTADPAGASSSSSPASKTTPLTRLRAHWPTPTLPCSAAKATCSRWWPRLRSSPRPREAASMSVITRRWPAGTRKTQSGPASAARRSPSSVAP